MPIAALSMIPSSTITVVESTRSSSTTAASTPSTATGLRFFSPDELGIIQEMHAIQKPMLEYVGGSTQRSSQPSSHTTLVLQFCIYRMFGVDVSEGIFVEDLVSLPYTEIEKLKFSVLQPNGTYMDTLMRDFSEDGRDYFFKVQAELIWRFHDKRGGYFYYEVLGMCLDPVLFPFAQKVLGPELYKETTAWISPLVADSRPLARSPSSSGASAQTTASDRDRLEFDFSSNEPAPAHDEFDEFAKHGPHRLFLKHFKIEGGYAVTMQALLSLIAEYNPMTEWGVKSNQTRFPGIFHLNLTVLAHLSSTAFVESIFSIAGKMLVPEKNRLSEARAVALVLCKVFMFVERRNAAARCNPEAIVDTDDELEELEAMFAEESECEDEE